VLPALQRAQHAAPLWLLSQDCAEGAFVDETRYRCDVGSEGAICFYWRRNFSYDVMSFLRFFPRAKRGEQIDSLAGA
jgi:hypothetical protein